MDPTRLNLTMSTAQPTLLTNKALQQHCLFVGGLVFFPVRVSQHSTSPFCLYPFRCQEHQSSTNSFSCSTAIQHNMPPLLTQVARTMDGLPLVSSQTPTPGLPVTNKHQQEAKEIIRKMTVGGAPNRMSVDAGDQTFSYMTRDNLCFLVLTEAQYPKRLAFLYLEDVADLILGELTREFGNEVREEKWMLLCG
jgi:Regulated-SNARE-like domain